MNVKTYANAPGTLNGYFMYYIVKLIVVCRKLSIKQKTPIFGNIFILNFFLYVLMCNLLLTLVQVF